MYRRILLIIIAAAAWAAASCEVELKQKVDVGHLPNASPMLNVVSFISPGEPVRVEVFEVRPIVYNSPVERRTNDYMRVATASVSLTCVATGQRFDLVYADSIYLCPDSQPDIVPGGEYRLSVEAKGFPLATASTVVPQADFGFSHTDVKITPIREDGIRYGIRIAVDNRSATEQVFRVRTQTHDSRVDYVLDTLSCSGCYKTNPDTTWAYVLMDDSFIVLPPSSSGFVVHTTERWDHSIFDTLRVDVMIVNEDYHKYHVSLDAASGTYYFIEGGNMVSNIDGGQGVFAGYIRQMKYIVP